MAEAASLVAVELAPCRFEMPEGGGVCIDAGTTLTSPPLSLSMLSTELKSVVTIESCPEDEESNFDDSTGGKTISGFGETWCT